MATILPINEEGWDVFAPLTRPCERCSRQMVGRPGQKYCSAECRTAVRDAARSLEPGYQESCTKRAKDWYADCENRCRHAANTAHRKRLVRNMSEDVKAMPEIVASVGKSAASLLAALRRKGRQLNAGELVELMPEAALYKAIRSLARAGEIELRVAPTGSSWEPITEGVWSAPAPSISGHIPGGATRIDWVRPPSRPMELRDVVHIHGALSNLLGKDHGGPNRGFAVLPARGSRAGDWWVYWYDDSGAAMAGKEAELRIGQQRCSIRFGFLTRPMLPLYAPGKYDVVIDAITPVVIRRSTAMTGGHLVHSIPSSQSILHSLLTEARERLGIVELKIEDLAMDITEAATTFECVDHGGHIQCPVEGRGKTAGWTGRVKATVNAPTRWLLECASRGMGLGSRRGYGMGRIVVK